MVVAGQLVFDRSGQSSSPVRFLTQDGEGYPVLFVPFRDGTSGNQTYGAGRYLEMPYEPGEQVVELDFNSPTTHPAPSALRTTAPIRRQATTSTSMSSAGEMLPRPARIERRPLAADCGRRPVPAPARWTPPPARTRPPPGPLHRSRRPRVPCPPPSCGWIRSRAGLRHPAASTATAGGRLPTVATRRSRAPLSPA